MTTITDPAAEVAAWNATNKSGVLVQWRRTAGADFTETGKTWGSAYLLKDVPTVRCGGAFVPLPNVRLHPLTEQLAALEQVEVPELYFPSPPCEYCHVDTQHDGDGFACPQCGAWWTSNGTDGVRRCVECRDEEAEVLGADEQPRCLPCAAEVLAGDLEATAPYRCRRCSGEVVGIGPQHGRIFTESLCGGCSDSIARDADLARWRAERASAGAK